MKDRARISARPPEPRSLWLVGVASVCAVLLGLVSTNLASAQAAPGASLEEAYKREFAFLEAEKHTLQVRINAWRGEHSAQVEAARAELDKLQSAVMTRALEADRLAESLTSTEREADAAGESADVIETLLGQIESTLDRGGITLPEPSGRDAHAARLAQLEFGFERALPLLARAGEVRRVQGEYFTDAGQKVSGDIVQIGAVAAFGLAPQAPGALAPAGDGRLKLWPQAAGRQTAEELAKGERPSTVGIFLYETLEKGIEQRQEKTVREVIASGGEIGWVIVVGGVLVLVLAVLRLLALLPDWVSSRKVVDRMAPLLRSKQFGAALDLANGTRGALGRVLAATLRNIERPREQLEDAIDEAVLHETPRIDRFGAAIFVIAAVSPLLGLLGTVTGMIATFDIITEFGTGNPKLLSNGISIALVTTELGLIVAIPSLVLGNFLAGWAERIKDDLERTALRVTNLAHGAHLVERSAPSGPITPNLNDEALATS